MDGGARSPVGLALEIVIQLLTWLGPTAQKYIDSLVQRLAKASDDFEILDMKMALDVVDGRGRTAIYTKREHIRFLRDNITSIYDYGWGTGDAFASHRVKPGHVVERRQVGSRYRSLILLPEPQNKGDEMTFTVRRLWKGSLKGRPNWLEAEVHHNMRHLALGVTLPRGRRMKSARLFDRKGPMKPDPRVNVTAQGRHRVQAEISKPIVGNCYTLEWDW